MKHILFRRILLANVVITVLLLLSLEFYLSGAIKDDYISKLRNSLITQAGLIADQIPASPNGDLDSLCRRFKEKTGARITIIDSSGNVLGDSDEASAKMENHSNRPEIKDADISDVGSSIRHSKTLNRNLFYLAIAFTKDTDKKFLRLSMPLKDIETSINNIRKRIIIASLAVLFVISVFGLLQTRGITRSIEEITDFSKEVAAGNFKKRIFFREKGELGELGKNIINMARELHERLRQSDEEKRKVEAILRNMSDGLILSDMKGTIILSNDAVLKLFGVTSGIEGKTLMETLRKAELSDMVGQVASGKEKIFREMEVTQPKDLHLMVTASPFYARRADGELSGIVLTFHDITRLKKLEEIRKDFVANVSHEIKTPITAIKGFAETLIEGALDDRDNAEKFLLTIKQNSERINSLVDDLLTLSRIELGDIKIEKNVVNIEEVIETVFTTLKEKAGRKNLYLKKEISPDTAELKADKDRLIQILLNLVDNGLKFTEKGGVTVAVQSSDLSESPEASKFEVQKEEGIDSSLIPHPSSFLTVSVEDTGIGIPKKHLDRLGERFYRVDRARSRELGGTGLGLAIVKHLVKAHGWGMKIESAEGQGTAVRILCTVG